MAEFNFIRPEGSFIIIFYKLLIKGTRSRLRDMQVRIRYSTYVLANR